MEVFAELRNINEDLELEDKDIILDSIESLTRFYDDAGKEIPNFCRFKAIQDDFGLSDKELIDLAKDNGYNVFKIITENNSEFVIAHPDCSEEVIKEAVFDDETPIKVEKVEFKEVSEMIKEAVKSKLTRKDVESLVDDIYNKLKSIDKPREYTTGGEYYGSTQLFRTHGTQLELLKHVQDTFGPFNCKDAYVVQVGGAYKYDDYKEELHRLYDLFPRLSFDIYGSIEVEGKTCRLVHTYGSNFSFYGVDFFDAPAKKEVKEEAKDPLADLKFSKYKFLLDVYDREDNFIERKLFRSRPEADRFVDAMPDLYDIKIHNNEMIELKNGKTFIGTYWKVIRDIKKKDESLKEEIITSNSVAKEIASKLKLSKGDYNTLLHDINNLRGDEWLEQVKSIGDEELLKKFKNVAQIEDLEEDEPIQLDSDKVKLTDLEPEDLKYAGVKEDIEKHEELNPVLFENNKLKPEIREALQKVADAFVEDLKEDEINIKVNDVILVGSNCSYNYTKDSDLDIHIIADSSALECPKELVDKLYSAYRSIFNKNYDITIKDIPAEIYVELDTLGAAKSNGIYSIMKDEWIKEPVQQDIPDLDQESFDKLFTEWEDRYFDLVGGREISEPNFVDTNDELEESKTLNPEYDYYEVYCEKGEELEYSNDNFSLCISLPAGSECPEEEDVEAFFKENYPDVIGDYHVVAVWDTINDFADDEISLDDFETVYPYKTAILASLNESLFDDIDKFITDIYELRKTSIAKDGEYGLGNLVFKEMRNLGYLDNLKELKKQERAKELSLEQLGESSKQSKREKRVKGVLFGNEDKHHAFCVITPENPMSSTEFHDKDNLPRVKEFRKELKDRKIVFTPIKGKYGSEERSFFLYDITLDVAKELAKKYGQQSFFFGKVNPDNNATVQFWERPNDKSDYTMKEENDKIDVNQERDNYYSIVGNNFKFSFDMDYFK